MTEKIGKWYFADFQTGSLAQSYKFNVFVFFLHRCQHTLLDGRNTIGELDGQFK
jgi:hypothetical protein